MKASNLKDGYLFIVHARTKDGQELRNILVRKLGFQISYFGTEYWDRANEIEIKEYRRIIPDQL